MSKRPVINVSESVKTRLLNKARSSGSDFNQLLQHYAMERFLYRLGCSAHAEKFILKGAMMLSTLSAEIRRTTMDIDLLGMVSNDHDVLRKVIGDCCAIQVADGIVFDFKDAKLDNITEGADYHGVRIRFFSYLGPARIHIQIDIGFGDPVNPKPRYAEIPEILDFGAPRLKVYPAESAIAEKLHALVTRDAINSRMKDFYDIHQMSSCLRFEGKLLLRAISATFRNRGTPIPEGVPIGVSSKFSELPDKQKQWKAFILKSGIEAALPLEAVVADLAIFLIPVLRAGAQGASFDLTWQAGGPWS